MRSRDCGAITDALRRVVVGRVRGIVGAIYGCHGVADSGGGDQARVKEVGNQFGVRAAGGSPGHCDGIAWVSWTCGVVWFCHKVVDQIEGEEEED